MFTDEPLAIDSPLRKPDSVILTPHTGWTVEEVFEEFAQIACTQLIEYLNGTVAKAEEYTYSNTRDNYSGKRCGFIKIEFFVMVQVRIS